MSTMAEVSAPRSRRSPVLRILLWLLLIALAAAAVAAGYAYHVAHAALPQLDGRLQVAGLMAPVTVTRDGHGVPTIEAANLEDLFFAQGYVPFKTWWRVGFAASVVNLTVWSVIGFAWWKVIGYW